MRRTGLALAGLGALSLMERERLQGTTPLPAANDDTQYESEQRDGRNRLHAS
jgi:hypothetical protein